LITRGLYAFFTTDDKLETPVEQQDGLCHVKLVEFAGMVSLLAHRQDATDFHALAKTLLVRLQELARPEKTMTASRYRQEQIVKLFGRRVVYHDTGKILKRSGVLQGIVGQTDYYYIKMRICGSDTWEMPASLQSLADATIMIYEDKAGEDKAGEDKAGEWVNCNEHDDKPINAGQGDDRGS
jgi:starvation-inducible outer membrane lipoprotein